MKFRNRFSNSSLHDLVRARGLWPLGSNCFAPMLDARGLGSVGGLRLARLELWVWLNQLPGEEQGKAKTWGIQ